MHDPLQRFSIRDYLFRAGLARIADPAQETHEIKAKIDSYIGMDAGLAGSREFQLLQNIIADVEEDNVEAYQAHLTEFDKIHTLDDWKTSILLKIKAVRFEAEPDLT